MAAAAFAVVFAAVLAALPHTVSSQIPSACVNQNSLENKVCCPNNCSGERGICEDIPLENQSYNDSSSDVRRNWPHYFTRACACKNNYAGVDCTRCKYGYHGDNCMTKVSLPRRNVLNLTEAEWTKYHNILKMARTYDSGYKIIMEEEEKPPGTNMTLANQSVDLYYLFIWLHHYAAKDSECNKTDSCTKVDYAHEATGFPTWHRHYMLWLEWELQYMLKATGDPDYYKFRISYWDWRKKTRADIFKRDRMGVRMRNAKGQPGVEGNLFSEGWNTICWYDGSGGVIKAKGTTCNPSNNTGPLLRCPYIDDTNSELGPCHSDYTHWPSMEDYDRAIAKNHYDTSEFTRMTTITSFRNFMEGFEVVDNCEGNELCREDDDELIQRRLHNAVHIVLGLGSFIHAQTLPSNMTGVMADTAASPNDPIFINHHAMVDCILEEWLQRHKDVKYPTNVPPSLKGHRRDDYIVPFFPLYKHSDMFKTADNFGYSCDLSAGASWVLQGSSWVLLAAILWNMFLTL